MRSLYRNMYRLCKSLPARRKRAYENTGRHTQRCPYFHHLQDAFETIVLPRRPTRRFRLTRIFYTLMWHLWSGIGRKIRSLPRRDNYLSYFGPLSLLLWFIGGPGV